MNTLEVKGDWNITKGKLKQKWASLTDDDLQYIEGKQEELLGRIQKRTGETREAIEKIISGSCCGSSHQPTDEARKPDEKAAGGCCSSDHTHTHTPKTLTKQAIRLWLCPSISRPFTLRLQTH